MSERLAASTTVEVKFLQALDGRDPGPITARWRETVLNSQPQVEGETKAAVDFSYGIMVALMIPDTLAATIVMPDGQPADDLHITLAYLGSTEDVEDDSDFLLKLLGAVKDVVIEQKPLSGFLSGIGRFTGETQDAFYLSADIPGLEDLRGKIVEALVEAEVPADRTHGFTPHVTLAYLSRDAEIPMQRVEPRAVEFTELAVVYGENVIPVPFGGDPSAEEDEPPYGDRTLPATTSPTVNEERKAFDEAAHPRGSGGMFAPKNKAPAGQAKPGDLPPDWLERVLAGDSRYVKPKGGGGGGKGKKGGGGGKAAAAKRAAERKARAAERARAKAAGDKESLDEADRRDAFDDQVESAENAERIRHEAAVEAIESEEDADKQAEMRAAEDERQKQFRDKLREVRAAERSRRRGLARQKRVRKAKDSAARASATAAAAGGKK